MLKTSTNTIFACISLTNTNFNKDKQQATGNVTAYYQSKQSIVPTNFYYQGKIVDVSNTTIVAYGLLNRFVDWLIDRDNNLYTSNTKVVLVCKDKNPNSSFIKFTKLFNSLSTNWRAVSKSFTGSSEEILEQKQHYVSMFLKGGHQASEEVTNYRLHVMIKLLDSLSLSKSIEMWTISLKDLWVNAVDPNTNEEIQSEMVNQLRVIVKTEMFHLVTRSGWSEQILVKSKERKLKNKKVIK
jgi:hypothetical protein